MNPLLPGDRCYIVLNGRRLRGVIGDYLPMRARGQVGKQAIVPFQRGKVIRWVPRGDLRKLPAKKELPSA